MTQELVGGICGEGGPVARHLAAAPRPESPQMLWKAVPGFPDYEISEHGDLRRGLKYCTVERQVGSGRKRYSLSKNGLSKKMHAAHLVALAFIGPKPFEGAEVCHNDGFEHNNHYSNLRWDTHVGNVADKLKHAIRKADGAGLHVPRSRRLKMAANEILSKAARPT